MFWDQHNSIQRLSSFIKGPLCRNWAPEKATLVLACTDRNYMHDNSVTPKLFHLVRHICCTDEISGNQWSRGPTPQAWQETQKYSCLLGDLQLSASTISLLYFFKKQYHHYHSPNFVICYITRNEETGIHTDLHQLLQNCTAWSKWYRN